MSALPDKSKRAVTDAERAAARLDEVFQGLACPSADDLAALIDGEASSTKALRRHMADCPACSAAVNGSDAMHGDGGDADPVPAALLAKARLGHRRPPAQPLLLRLKDRRTLAVFSMAAAAVVALVAAFLLLAGPKTQGSDEVNPAVTPEVIPSWMESMTPRLQTPARTTPLPVKPPPEKTPMPEEVEKPIPAPSKPPVQPTPRQPTPAEVEKPKPPKTPDPKPLPPVKRHKPTKGVTVTRKTIGLALRDVLGSVFVTMPGASRASALTTPSDLPFGTRVSTPAGRTGVLHTTGGFSLFLNTGARAVLKNHPKGLDIEFLGSGEILVEGSPKASSLSLSTGAGAILCRGTAGFSVAGSPERPRVSVFEGSVLIRTHEGEVLLAAGLSLCLGPKADKPRRFDANRALSWTHPLRPDETVLRIYDFETGGKGWKGRLVSDRTFRNSRRALHAIKVKDRQFTVALSKTNRNIFTFRPGTFLILACWTDTAAPLAVRFWNRTQRRAFTCPLPPSTARAWTRLHLDVALAVGRLPAQDRPAPGDVISSLVIGARIATEPELVVDDVTFLYRAAPPPTPRAGGFVHGPRPEGMPSLVPDCRCRDRRRSPVCRFAHILKLLVKFAPAVGGGDRKGKGSSEPEKPKDEDKEGDDDKPTPPKKPPTPGRGSAPGPFPPGPPPFPPGPGPGPPKPPPPPQDSDPKDPDPEDDEEGDEDPTPKTPKALPGDGSVHAWLLAQLPRYWPPSTDWRPPTGQKKCLRSVEKWLSKNPLPRAPWKRADIGAVGPFEAWLRTVK
jgi:hypothetical protein